MIKYITKLVDTRRLRKAAKNPLEFYGKEGKSNITWIRNGLAGQGRNFFKRFQSLPKGDKRRGYIAHIINTLRNEFPFQPVDYSKAKAMYNEYFTMPGHIEFEDLIKRVKRGETIHVVRFRNEAPVKGNGFSDYYINSSFGDAEDRVHVAKITGFDDKYKYFKGHMASGDSISGLDESFYTSYRYATTDEIFKFGVHESKIKSLNAVLDEMQERRTAIYKEIRELNNCAVEV